MARRRRKKGAAQPAPSQKQPPMDFSDVPDAPEIVPRRSVPEATKVEVDPAVVAEAQRRDQLSHLSQRDVHVQVSYSLNQAVTPLHSMVVGAQDLWERFSERLDDRTADALESMMSSLEQAHRDMLTVAVLAAPGGEE